MTYGELLLTISQSKEFDICKSEYSEECFGDFMLEFKYKKSIQIQIINDRGIIEIFIIAHNLFSACAIPFKYVVGYMLKTKCKDKIYTFSDVIDAYNFLNEHVNILDEIVKNNMLKTIVVHWKTDNI